MAQARAKTPENLRIWHDRIERHIHAQQLVAAGLQPGNVLAADPALIAQAAQTYGSWRIASDMVRASGIGPGVLTMMCF